MSKIIAGRIERLNNVIAYIKANSPQLKTNDEISKLLGYKRAGTVSDYLNMNNYKEDRFESFVTQFCHITGANFNYIIKNQGQMFEEPSKLFSATGDLIEHTEQNKLMQDIKDTMQTLQLQFGRLENALNINKKGSSKQDSKKK